MSCICCNKPLKVWQSIERGMGPICYSRKVREFDEEEILDTKIDLPFNPQTMDIICRRDPDGTKHFNIFQVFKHHSPSGFEWGYGGSGPADFCLNIIALFTNDLDKQRDVRLWDGQKISRTTWNLYQRFKCSSLFGSLGKNGGTIKGSAIRQWVAKEISASRLAFAT